MLGFPTPYSNELLYSVIARAGVHEGETSPKQLLDSVFANRKVIATVDLPCHVESIASQYVEPLELTSKVLIKKHTLWPAYAPFMPNQRRIRVEKWMLGESKGSIHLATGLVASRIRAKQKLMLCESCRDEHEQKYGEALWDRRWQVPLVHYCPLHGPLSETDINLNGEHRHAFIPISQSNIVGKMSLTKSDIFFSELTYELFDGYTNESPSYRQWSCFYRNLAIGHGLVSGKRLDHRGLLDEYVSYWGKDWLRRTNLMPSQKDSSWLKSIFQKHRKAFSFAEHLTVIDAISSGRIQISEAIARALRYKIKTKKPEVKVKVDLQERSKDQNDWSELLHSNGPKGAREIQPALYARLYRNHHDWLMCVNQKNQLPTVNINDRVDWRKRDRQTSKTLLSFLKQAKKNLFMPRLSKTFLIHQIDNSSTIEKNLYRLPRSRAVLERKSESIDEYQIRRLNRAIIEFRARQQDVKKWILLREAGLSEERMTRGATIFIKEIFDNGG